MLSIPSEVVDEIFILQHLLSPLQDWPHPDIELPCFTLVLWGNGLLFKLRVDLINDVTMSKDPLPYLCQSVGSNLQCILHILMA